MFMELLRTQLLMKNLMTKDEWNEVKEQISIDYLQDTQFAELKNAEILRERLATLRELDEYVGKYYSLNWVRTNVLMQTDEDMKEISGEIDQEFKAGAYGDPNADL
jgi:hypothetical protein